MRVKSMVTVGFLSIVVATGVASAPDDVASETQRVNSIERMGVRAGLPIPPIMLMAWVLVL
jgi:hypothetical protein